MAISTKHYILTKNKKVVTRSLLNWAQWFETADRIVKQEYISKSVLVSTVFLGLDYNFSGKGKPLLFETMVFKKTKKDWDDLDMDRYSTYEQALKGHAKMVKKWSK